MTSAVVSGDLRAIAEPVSVVSFYLFVISLQVFVPRVYIVGDACVCRVLSFIFY